MQEYTGKFNFSTDAWTSPNHRAYVAFCVHLQYKGSSLSFPLDIIKVAKIVYSLREVTAIIDKTISHTQVMNW